MADFVTIADVKDDLGITGSTHDAWLQRRINGALARMSTYTHRYIGPFATFTDTWRPENYEVGTTVYWPNRRDTIFTLRHFPVSEIDEAKDNDIVVSGVVFEAASGALIGYGNEASLSRFMMPEVTYVAGWETLPADLYEVLIGVLMPLWQQRANAAAGLTGAGSVSIQDVGDIDFSNAQHGTAFERAASGQVVDPILGPYAAILDGYTDRRAVIGSVIMPRTSDPVLVTP